MVIRIFNVQLVKIPHFKSPLTIKQAGWPYFLLRIFNVHIMNVNYAKFQKKVWYQNDFKGITLRPSIQTSLTLVIFFVLTRWIINEFEKLLS